MGGVEQTSVVGPAVGDETVGFDVDLVAGPPADQYAHKGHDVRDPAAERGGLGHQSAVGWSYRQEHAGSGQEAQAAPQFRRHAASIGTERHGAETSRLSKYPVSGKLVV